ncbi:MAG: rRNA pseudouridine synthase [Rhodanobacter sp.]|jgi:16S rRNA pseudouridine516 synthase|nr:rRNA pseudouridine synthase [Rhodanobacter sp.]
MKLLKLIANLGYGSRKDVRAMFRAGCITDVEGHVLYAHDTIEHTSIRVDGELLDPPSGLVIAMHKPVGYTCSTRDAGHIVHDLLPPRWRARSPAISTIGRLDRDTSGLLLLTDDGALLHRVISPRSQIEKVYEATLARDLRGDEAAIFAGGMLLLEAETTPLAPAQLDIIDARHVRLAITEGRYHQVRRMFAAVGNHVEALHRVSIGALALGECASGTWSILDAHAVARIFQLRE